MNSGSSDLDNQKLFFVTFSGGSAPVALARGDLIPQTHGMYSASMVAIRFSACYTSFRIQYILWARRKNFQNFGSQMAGKR